MNFTFLILTIAPALAIFAYFFNKERFNKETIKLVLVAFFFGIFSLFPAAVATKLGGSFIVNKGNLINTFLFSFLVVALSQEFAKFFFLRYILFKKNEFAEPLDAVIYALIVGMGFATFDNFIYVIQFGNNVSILPMLICIIANTILAIIMSYHIGLAKFDLTHKYELLRKGFVYPVLLHGIYTFLLLQNWMLALLVLAIFGVWFSVKYLRYIFAQVKNNTF